MRFGWEQAPGDPQAALEAEVRAAFGDERVRADAEEIAAMARALHQLAACKMALADEEPAFIGAAALAEDRRG